MVCRRRRRRHHRILLAGAALAKSSFKPDLITYGLSSTTTSSSSSYPAAVQSTYSVGDAVCWELSAFALERERQQEQQEEEDEVELWYPTKRRYFEFSLLTAPSSSTLDDEDDPSTILPPNIDNNAIDEKKDDDDKEEPTIVTVRQTSFGCGKFGGEVWTSSIALCLRLLAFSEKKKSSSSSQQQEEQDDDDFDFAVQGRRVLELGSGCGLPSIVCRDVLQARAVLATDFWQMEEDFENLEDKNRVVPTKYHALNLEHNVVAEKKEDDENDDEKQKQQTTRIKNKNGQRRRRAESAVQRLDWHDPEGAALAKASFKPDLIIGSDLIYYPMDVDPLLNTLQTLLLDDGDDQSSSHNEQDNGECEDKENSSEDSSRSSRSTRAFLVFPLSPSEREALPEFRTKLPGRFHGTTHAVEMDEVKFLYRETGEISRFLTISIVPKKRKSD